MRYRRLGTTEPQISEISFGASHVGGQHKNVDEALRALARAFELGVTLVDTAPASTDSQSEQLVGRALQRSIHRVFAAAKISPLNDASPAPIQQAFPYDHIIRSTEQSLRNLGVEQIYLQQFQTWNDDWTPTGEWRRAIEDLRASGKVRFFGVCLPAHAPDSALEAVRTGLFNSVQVVYNIFDQSAAKNLFPLCLERKVAVLARAPLATGGLTGVPTAGPQVLERSGRLKRDLAGIPGTLAEIALRFCLAHSAVTAVLPAMHRVTSVESSCRASTAGTLSAATVSILRRHAWDAGLYRETQSIGASA